MSPVTHFFAGWMLASAFPSKQPTSLTRREKILVVGSALVPDLDGAGIIPELLPRSSSHPLLWFSEFLSWRYIVHPALDSIISADVRIAPGEKHIFAEFGLNMIASKTVMLLTELAKDKD